MPRPSRSELFDPAEVGIGHAVQRCVCRAFLAGVDQATGNDYSYRKEWIRKRMEALASVFGVDILAYSVLSNHLHLILRTRPDVIAASTESKRVVGSRSILLLSIWFPCQRSRQPRRFARRQSMNSGPRRKRRNATQPVVGFAEMAGYRH